MRFRLAMIPFLVLSLVGVVQLLPESVLGNPPAPAAPAKPPTTAAPAAAPAAAKPVAQPTPAQLLAHLGKRIFHDTTLSNPPGMACATCHSQSAGWTYPDSNVNLLLGPVPGIVPGRFGNRKPPTIAYAKFSPAGPQFAPTLGVYVGGLFWDGRVANLTAQAAAPFVNPNEMNNIVHNVAAPQLVVQKIQSGPYALLFQRVFGQNVFTLPVAQVFAMVTQALAAFESTPEVSPFSSKYDLVLAGKAQFTASELDGLRLFTGSTTGRPGGPAFTSAQCFRCHGIPTSTAIGPDLFTLFGYLNTGVPKNPNNPYYKETDAVNNPLGYNPLGAAYIDLGLGDYLYPSMGLPSGNMGTGNNGKGDFLAINGTFKTPTVRNVDKRPNPLFVKAYMHNGVFKSLAQVVHFYNARNLTTHPGEVIDFTGPAPYAGLVGTPQFAPPEFPSVVTMVNPTGKLGGIGNLGLTAQQEADIVAFLQTLTDN